MNIKSILIGAAAAAAAATSAQAADLPSAPEPVDYVRVCDAFGSGFYYLPGTETCVKVGGRIRTEFRVRNFGDDAPDLSVGFQNRDQNGTEFRARGYIRVDSRTNTEYGILRTYASLWIQNQTGAGNVPSLEFGFIQFGGLTAGRAISFFENYAGDTFASIQSWGGTDIFSTNLFAYTYSFGNGFSATASIEDGLQNRGSILGRSAGIAAGNAHLSTGSAAITTTIPVAGGALRGDIYGGHRLPDFVANLRVDQGWGSAQIMGVLHQVWNTHAGTANSLGLANFGIGGVDGVVNDDGLAANTADSELGWAIAGGVTVNVPQIGHGDTVTFQAGYSEGATGYVTSGLPNTIDAALSADGTNIELTDTWTISGGFNHNWTAHWSSAFNIAYTDFDVAYGDQFDIKSTSIQGNLVWAPSKGFLIGAEVNYTDRDYDSASTLEDTQQLGALIRIQRTF